MKTLSIPKRWGHLLTPKGYAILDACLIGLASGLAAVLLKRSIEGLRFWRLQLALNFPPWLLLPLIGLGGGLLAGWLVNSFAREASGSGVPQVKAALSGFPVPLNGRMAIVKLLSNAIALGSGLVLGRQGPTVQIGASLAAQLSRWIPTSPDYQRQMIAAGAAAGLAAGFNAPIAGVMFAVEELLHDVSGFTLGPTLLAAFIGAVVSQVLGGPSLSQALTLIAPLTSFSALEIPFYLALGVLAGLLGVLFGQGILSSLAFNRHVLRLTLPWRVALAGLISGLMIAVLPVHFRTAISLREFLISEGADIQTAALALGVYLILTIVAAGSGAPGGLFAPTLVIGAALGYLVGAWQWAWLGVGFPTTYALTGMGALFCVVYKAPITAVIIIFEITRDFDLVLPLMIGSVVAFLVSEMVDRGSLYDKLQELDGIQLKRDNLEVDPLHTLLAAHVMTRSPLETLSSNQTLAEVIQTFAHSRHHGFPVVEEGQLVGIITQTDLVKLYKQLASAEEPLITEQTPLKAFMTPQPITVSPRHSLSDVLYLLTRYHLTRLPVTEDGKLVGMITMTDVIRAETGVLSSYPLEPVYSGPVRDGDELS